MTKVLRYFGLSDLGDMNQPSIYPLLKSQKNKTLGKPMFNKYTITGLRKEQQTRQICVCLFSLLNKTKLILEM